MLLRFFEVDPKWEEMHSYLAELVADAAEELLEFCLPAATYSSEGSELKANRKVREHLQKQPGNAYFVSIANEAVNAADAVQGWLKANSKSTDIKKDRKKFQKIAAEQAVHQRRLVEGLISSILFSDIQNNRDLYLSHHEICREYDSLQKTRDSLIKNFETTQSNALISLDPHLDQRIKEMQTIESDPNFDFSNCWYLKAKKPLNITKADKYPSMLRSFESAAKSMKTVLTHNPAPAGIESLEKAALGLMYESIFGASSEDIHFSPNNSREMFLTERDFQQAIVSTNLLSAAAICRCFAMNASKASLPKCQKLFDAMVNPTTHPFYDSVLTPKGVKGDLLNAQIHDDRVNGEIVDVFIHPNTKYVMYEVRPYSTTRGPFSNVMVPATDVVDFFDQQHFDMLINEIRNANPLWAAGKEYTFAKACSEDYESVAQMARKIGMLSPGAKRMIFQIDMQ